MDRRESNAGRFAAASASRFRLRMSHHDASVVALAERLAEAKVATLDQRHFRAVRPAHVEALELLP